MVQHFMLVGRLTVTENIVLGMAAQGMKLDLSKHAEALSALSQTFGFDLDPNVQVYRLPVGMQQRAEILKLLYHKAEILILDEPTSVLTPREIEPFFGMLRKLKADGKTILFISHKLDKVMAIADDITVMRAGKVVASVPAADANQGMLARLMVGREVLFQVRRTAHGVGEIILEARALRAENDRGLPALDGLSFTVRAGEVYGIAGVDGNGQSELAEVIAGLRRTTSGTVKLNGADITSASAAERNRSTVSPTFPKTGTGRSRHGPIGRSESDSEKLRRSAVRIVRVLQQTRHRSTCRAIDPRVRRTAAVSRSGHQISIGREPAKDRAGARIKLRAARADSRTAHQGWT